MMNCFPENNTYTYTDTPHRNHTPEATPTNSTPRPTSELLDASGVQHVCYKIIMPAILTTGIVGNIFNLFVFTRRKLKHRMEETEKSVMAGLVSLALSDLMFCITALPGAFLTTNNPFVSDAWHDTVSIYYTASREGLLNTFQFSSTWLVVIIGIERCLAVSRPIHTRWIVRVRNTIILHVIAYAVAVLFNLPLFFKLRVVKLGRCYYLSKTDIMDSLPMFFKVYTYVWSGIGTFLPLGIMIFCNVRLIKALRLTLMTNQVTGEKGRRLRTSNYFRMTVILITIIVLFVALVCPSAILSLLATMLPPERKNVWFTRFLYITNVAQTLNFSVNFLLYCTLSESFRKTAKESMCRTLTTSTTSSESNQRYHLVVVRAAQSLDRNTQYDVITQGRAQKILSDINFHSYK